VERQITIGVGMVANVANLPYDWTGIYGGVHGGYGWGDIGQSFPADGGWYINSLNPIFPRTHSNSLNGGMIGGHLGANYQSGAWVFGLEGSWEWANLKKQFDSPEYPGAGVDYWQTNADWVATVTPRVGYAFDKTLIYLKGGYAAARVGSRLCTTSNGCASRDEGKSTNNGWTIGAGIEYAWLNNFIFGLEYNYYDFGSERHLGPVGAGPVAFPTPRDVDLSMHSVLARLSYKFNWQTR
jgi:outer membrane immunogenic protein